LPREVVEQVVPRSAPEAKVIAARADAAKALNSNHQGRQARIRYFIPSSSMNATNVIAMPCPAIIVASHFSLSL